MTVYNTNLNMFLTLILILALNLNASLTLSSSTLCACYSCHFRILCVSRHCSCSKDRYILLSLYKSLVRPYMEYCISAWSPHYVKDKELLERIQHRLTRMIPELRNLPYLKRLEELKLWTLEERRTRADLIEVYKIIRGISSVSFDTFFEFHQYGQTRGHSLKLMKREHRRI